MSGTILVTGASGQLGRHVVEFLLERVPAEQIAALTRHSETLENFAKRGVSVRRGDYEDKQSLVEAFHGVEKLLLISGSAFTDVKSAHRNVIEAAQAAGVCQIFYTAIQRQPGSTVVIPQVSDWDVDTLEALAASGLDVTILRNSQYLDSLDDLIGALSADGVIRVPAGQGATAQATRREMAEATAAVLATDGHEGREYTLAGSQALTLDEIAEILGEITGEPVSYEDTPIEEYVSARVGAGLPEPAARFMGAWFQAIAAGEFTPSGDIERLTGHPQIPVRDFLSQRRLSQ